MVIFQSSVTEAELKTGCIFWLEGPNLAFKLLNNTWVNADRQIGIDKRHRHRV